MKENNSTLKTLRDLFHYDMSTFASAEIKLSNILPFWISKAGSISLKTVLQKYVSSIRENIENMKPLMEEESINSLILANIVMDAFIEQANEKLSSCADIEIKDACLLACMQTINHYKISIYGTAASFANTLGLEKQSAFFHNAEMREKHIDQLLSQIAISDINKVAKAPIALPQ